MKFTVLASIFTIIIFLHIVSAGKCCGTFDTNCCCKCKGGDHAGKECSSRGNSHPELSCGWCTGGSGNDCEGCAIGWKC
ncbi:hypothetical protein K492DRAFT_170598 [Lichtheimia hyalospora FSU 10163]|nr:hypothetical protein K492DRAFT_170598 [Lichtheimia hyalospora FSU 10163]